MFYIFCFVYRREVDVAVDTPLSTCTIVNMVFLVTRSYLGLAVAIAGVVDTVRL